jgi:hypothetical protein
MALVMLLPFRMLTTTTTKRVAAMSLGTSASGHLSVTDSVVTRGLGVLRSVGLGGGGGVGGEGGGRQEGGGGPRKYRLFKASSSWQVLEPDHVLPAGLEISVDVSTGVRKARLAAPSHPPSQDASVLLEHGNGDAGQGQRTQNARTDGQGDETGNTGSSEACDVRDRGAGSGAASMDGADEGKRGGGGGDAPAYVPVVHGDDFFYDLPALRIAVRSQPRDVMYI